MSDECLNNFYLIKRLGSVISNRNRGASFTEQRTEKIPQLDGCLLHECRCRWGFEVLCMQILLFFLILLVDMLNM